MKLNLGCNNIISNVKFLYKDFNLVSPYILYKNTEIIKNFDYQLIFDNKPSNILGIDSIGCERLDKSKQMLLLRQLGFNTPNFYKSVDESNMGDRRDEYYVLLEHLNDETELILKAESGARGIGQILLKKSELYDFFDDFNKEQTILTLLDKYNIGGEVKSMSESEIRWFNDTINKNDFLVTERVKIKSEYRVMLFYGEDPIIVQRSVDKNWQANISLNNSFKLVDSVFDKSFYEKLYGLLEHLNTPFLSTDVYEDINGNFGLFEFQMQFGYKALPKSLIINVINKSVHNLINKLQK